MANKTYGNNFHSTAGTREHDKAIRRKRFLKRMEAKLRFKESVYVDRGARRHAPRFE